MKTYIYEYQTHILTHLIDLTIFKKEPYILVQIFSGQGVSLLSDAIQTISIALPQAICIGTTTDGEIDNEHITTYKTIISISIFEQTSLKTAYAKQDNAFQSGVKLASELITSNTKLLILFSDGTCTNAEELLQGIESFNASIPICGGMAGDNGQFVKTYISSQQTILSEGVVGVSLNSDCLDVTTDYKFDWRTIGLEHTIDKVNGNRIYAIDGMAPIDFYEKYLGNPISPTEFPLIIKKNGIARARAVIAKHDDGSVSFSGNLTQGDKVRIGFGDAKALLTDPTKVLTQLHLQNVETFFIYSCMARRRYMPDLIHHEIEPFAKRAPTVGFFTYSEFYHHQGHNELLNQVLSVVALNESTPGQEITPEIPLQEDLKHSEMSYAKTIQSLSNLIQQSSRDYEEQSKQLEQQMTYSNRLLTSHKQFLRYTVHEMNTPLNAIMSNIELHELKLGNSIYLENIEVGLKSIFSLYDDLSYLVKKDYIPSLKQRLDLVDYIRSRLDFFTQVVHKAKSNFIFESNVPEFYLFFNQTKLRRIIDNNLTNAIKYTYENENIYVALAATETYCDFSIASHSRKIQKPEKVFEEYYREDSLQHGFGLGLTLVKEICDEENIAISLQTNEQQTVFSYRFLKELP